jgi:catalase
MSQTESEQQHIADALTFELSKVERLAIRTRMVSHLLNIDRELAEHVAQGLRLKEMPRPADAARPMQEHLRKSPALSIQLNGPVSFKGRKVGALVTDGVDSAILQALRIVLQKEGALLEIIAPQVGGVEASDGSWIEPAQQLRGGPSVLYDAVVLLPSEDGVEYLMQEPAARDFVADAFAHCKFIGYGKAALPLFGKAGVSDSRDDGCMALEGPEDCAPFIAMCRRLRFWARETAVQHMARQGI